MIAGSNCTYNDDDAHVACLKKMRNINQSCEANIKTMKNSKISLCSMGEKLFLAMLGNLLAQAIK